MGLRLTQWTKVYLVEAVVRRCSVKKTPWMFWQNSEKNACTEDFQILWEAGLPVYLKRDSYIRVFLWIFRSSFFIEHLWTATSVLGKTLKNFTINYDFAKYLTTLTIIEHYKWFCREYLKFCCSYEAIWKPYLAHDTTFFWKVFFLEKFP